MDYTYISISQAPRFPNKCCPYAPQDPRTTKNKFLSRATDIVVIGPRQIGKPYAAAAKLPGAHSRLRPFCRTRTKADLPSSSATAYTLQVLDSLIKIVNYIKSGALSFSGTSVSYKKKFPSHEIHSLLP